MKMLSSSKSMITTTIVLKDNFAYLSIFHMRRLYLIPLIFICYGCLAQQDVQFTQYMFNKQFYNPGSVGNENGICAKALMRQQWVGFKDDAGRSVSPQTYLLSVDAPVYAIHGGFGAIIYQDKLGYESNIGIKLSYALRLHPGKNNTLGLGAGFTLLNKSIDFSKFDPRHPGDPKLTGQGNEFCYLTDFSLGAWFQRNQSFYLGLSATQIRQARGAIGQSEFILKRYYYLMTGYDLVLKKSQDERTVYLEPSLLVSSDGEGIQFDVTGLINFNDQYYGGVGYRFQNAICLIAGLRFKEFYINLSYDITTPAFNGASRHDSPEIMIGYSYGLPPPIQKQSFYNTRFL
jgi:type IX secretion system PorP/SprF family membrane protein